VLSPVAPVGSRLLTRLGSVGGAFTAATPYRHRVHHGLAEMWSFRLRLLRRKLAEVTESGHSL